MLCVITVVLHDISYYMIFIGDSVDNDRVYLQLATRFTFEADCDCLKYIFRISEKLLY